MATKPLTIGYSGSLAFYEGDAAPVKHGGLRNWLWTYNHFVTDPSTRSASFLFRAVSELKKKYGTTSGQLQILLWGNIDQRYITQAKELGISDLVQIEGYLPKQVSLDRNASCDVLFLPMESPTEKGQPLFIPGKAFEYMNARKPVLALSAECDCMNVLSPSGLLQRFEPEQKNEITEWLNQVINNRSLLDRFVPNEAYIQQYSFRNITAQVAGVFRDVLGA